jgi:CBS domain-containing protein
MNWKPSNPLSVDQDRTLEQAEKAMPVRLIATFDNLITTTPDARVSQALGLANEGRFDYLPVRQETDGPFIGLFDRTSFQSENQLVREVYSPIGTSDLISAETSLLHFLWTANEQPRRLVLEKTEVRGIVTLSDIQKLPVRMALFSLFIHFELLLTEHLRTNLGNKDPLSLLSEARAQLVSEKWQRFKDSKMDQDLFSAMDLCDKREAAKAMGILGKSKTSIKSAISEIECYLRNPIAHGAEYAESIEAARRTVSAAIATKKWIDELRGAIAETSIG